MLKKTLRISLLVFLDVVTVGVAWLLSTLFLRYDLGKSFSETWYFLLGGVGCLVLFNVLFGLYTAILKYASVRDAIRICLTGATTLIYNLVVTWVSTTFVVGWAFICTMFIIAFLALTRFFVRFVIFFI